MKKYFLTLDLEEWYHLEYVKKYKERIMSSQRFAPKAVPFLEDMAREGMFMTIFVLADVAKENPAIVREIAAMGHEIACHGSGHELVYELSVDEFRTKTKEAKQALEQIVEKPVLGYRAPCFSMDNEKLGILWELGFLYDSSLIRFQEHELYNVLDVSSFEKVESIIYRKCGHYEFEVPTLDIFRRSIPISGGGYFRLFPLWLMKYALKRHWETESNFCFYIHPFEVTDEPLQNGKMMGIKNYFRFQVGRAKLKKKLVNYINWLKRHEVKFLRFEDYITEKKTQA